ncbi:phosphotransferase [Synechocystis sp. LKSZ1]|uniref:phosphotransferase n=1 Tax=Synechocystis sp. LKSZ1 TaxID=3144951 RepID=UPI00336BDA18
MKNLRSNTPFLKIEGRSGCNITIIQDREKFLVRKVSSSFSYNARLVKQARKQNEFKQLNSLVFFDSPKIFSQGITHEELNYFDMEYIAAEKFSSFLCRISVKQIQQIVKHIINYLDCLFESAQPTNPPIRIIYRKINDLKTILCSNENFNKEFKQNVFSFLEKRISKAKFYQGYCHGDLTFSNMLFCNNKIYLIDFLDSFVESPIIDLVKLRQDTKFFWSIIVDADLENYNSCKTMQILSYIDRYLEQYLLKWEYEMYTWYKYLELFNLVRIMPYVTKVNEINFVKKHIKILLNSYD